MPESKGPWKESPALDRLPPIFRRCLERESGRFDLGHPFAVEGFIYATNGRIVVRVARPEGWDFPNPMHPPWKAGQVFDDPTPEEFEPEPTPLPPVLLDECPTCHGLCVTLVRTCRGCHDAGGRKISVRCDCPDCQGRHECDGCHGSGVIGGRPCRVCGETGMMASAYPGVEVAPGFLLARRYIALLARFGASVFLPIDRTKDDPCRFVVGEVEGRLMGMKRGGQ